MASCSEMAQAVSRDSGAHGSIGTGGRTSLAPCFFGPESENDHV